MLGRNTHFTLAIHILTMLAIREIMECGPVASSKIAESINTNPAFLREQIGYLKKAGFVTTRLGSGGGTLLAKEAKDISLLDIYRMTEGETTLQCHKVGEGAACPLALYIGAVFGELENDLDLLIAQRLQQTSIADIAQRILPMLEQTQSNTK